MLWFKIVIFRFLYAATRGLREERAITMSGEGFDPCECMQHHLSVQHLLSILRQSQDYCTETECFNIPRVPGPQDVQEPTNGFLNICLIIGLIILMYAFRPRSLRQSTGNVIKSRTNEPGSRYDPPSPPTAQ